jgi:aminopeptidase N
VRAVLTDASLNPAFREQALLLPAEAYLAERMSVADPAAIHRARPFLREGLARARQPEWLATYEANATPGAYSPDAASAAKRALRNLALGYLADTGDAAMQALAERQYRAADNMTDRFAALTALVNSFAPGREAALADFYQRFEHDALVVDKWFSLQGMQRGEVGPHAGKRTIDTVRALMEHPAFTLRNPNRARALIFSFCSGNPAQFHAEDGSGYRFWAEQVLALDTINPQVAARLARVLDRWQKYAPALREHMHAALEQVAAAPALSRDVREIVGKALAA